MIGRSKNWLKYVALILSIMGLVTFSLFILEESFQTVMFGTWPAQDAQRWDIVYDGCKMMKRITGTMKVVNYTLGWIQPIAFISYQSYAESGDYYTRALRAKVLAHSPKQFEGEEITLTFRYNELKAMPDGSILLINGKKGIRVWTKPEKSVVSASGILTRHKNLFIIDNRKENGRNPARQVR